MADDPPAVRLVRAAGGVVTRRGPDGVEVLVVHRPLYDDWTLPKGKAERGETAADTARREVHEETGFVCAVGPAIADVGYFDRRGRPKLVRYYAMRVECGVFNANEEVVAIAWCALPGAVARLTYVRDHEVVSAGVAIEW